MHRAIAAWLSDKPWRALLVTALFGVLAPGAVIGGAIPVLLTLARDARLGFQATLAGTAATGAMLIASEQSLLTSIGWVALLYFAPFALALLLQRMGSLRLCFQVAVLCAAAMLVGIYVVMPDPSGTWERFAGEWARELAGQMKSAGFVVDERSIALLVSKTNWGLLALDGLLVVLSSLFLGGWWHSLLQAPGAFGKEFQQLRLGKMLGTAALVSAIAVYAFRGLKIEAPLIEALFWIAIAGLAIQGLAVVHRLKASGRLGKGWLTTVYVLLILPLTMSITVLVLAGCGVADNWRRMA